MKLFDMEFLTIYPSGKLFPYMAAICDEKGKIQLYIRQFNKLYVCKGFQRHMIKKKKIDNSNKYFMQLKNNYDYIGFKQELLQQGKVFIELPYHQFIKTIRKELLNQEVWGSGTQTDMDILNEGYQEQIFINDLQQQTEFMFTTANLMSNGCNHFPDEELLLFYQIINKKIPNTSKISFQDCSSNTDIDIETKKKYWEDAFQNGLINEENYNIRLQKSIKQYQYRLQHQVVQENNTQY